MKFFKKMIFRKLFFNAHTRAKRKQNLCSCHFKAYIVSRNTFFDKAERASVSSRAAIDGSNYNLYAQALAIFEKVIEICLFALSTNRSAVV